MIAWTQGKTFDDYTQQLLTLLGQRGSAWEAVRLYVPAGPGTDAYWDYQVMFKNHQGLPTSVLVGPHANLAAAGDTSHRPEYVLDMAMVNTDSAVEIKAREESWRMSYTYQVHLGPFGLYGELRPNQIAGSGMYGGYATPPDRFGTPPTILPQTPPTVEQPKPTPPAPVVQDLSGATTQSSAGISAVTPPAALGLADVLAFLLKADPQTLALLQTLLAMKR